MRNDADVLAALGCFVPYWLVPHSLIPYSLVPLPVRLSSRDLPTPQPGGSNQPASHLKRWLANTGSATAYSIEVSKFSLRIKDNPGGLW